MPLSTELIKSFVEVTKNQTDVKNETTVLGTVVTQGDKNYVKLDGSDLLTPVNSTSVLKNGERVMVMIKDHKATVTGNVSTPSARNDDMETVSGKVEEVKAEIGEFELVLADKVSTKELEAEIARIDNLTADNVFIKDQLTANNAVIEGLKVKDVEITGKLDAVEAEIGVLNTTKLDAAIADITFATIEDLEATNIFVNNLEANYGEFKDLTTDKLNATTAQIEDLAATTIKAGALEAYKGTIENLFSSKAEIDELKSKYIEALKLEVDDAKITQLEAALAKIETLEASLAKVETLVSGTVITDDLEANKALIDSLTAQMADIGMAIIDIAKIENLEAANAEIENLNTQYLHAVQANVDNLTAKSATIEQLKTYVLQSEFGEFKKLSVEDLEAAKAVIGTLESNYANIHTILSGSIGTGNLQTVHLTADNVVIDEAVIKDLIAAHIDVSDLHAGKISTNKFTIESDDGGVRISGSTQQFTDKNGKVRLQVGKDAKGDFNFIIFGEDGTTAIYDEKGITENAVPDGLIVDDMVSENANIQATKVQYVDDDGNGTTLQTHLKTEQGRISALIKETTIENEDGTITSLKDKYLSIDATVNGIKTTIGDVQFLDGESIVSKLVDIDATVDGITSTVSQHGTDIANAQSTIQQNADKIGLIVKSDDSESGFTITDEFINMSSKEINLKGLITISGLDSDVQNKLDKGNQAYMDLQGLDLTGRNMARITSVPVSKKDEWPGGENYILDAYRIVLTNNLNVGDSITVSFDYESSDIVAETGQTATLTLQGSGDVTELGEGAFETKELPVNAKERIVYTFKLTEDHLKNKEWMASIKADYVQSGRIHIENFKVEKGNKPTEWLQAPEDAFDIVNAWSSDAIVSGMTTINGGYIQTQTIKTDQLAVEEILAVDGTFLGIINAQEINANRITTGQLDAQRLNVYGLEVRHKDTEQITFHISEKGEVNLRGDIESFDYVSGKRGWSIKSDGSTEFNTVTVRGNVIGNDVGIIAGDGSGTNLQRNSSFRDGLNDWVNSGGHWSVDTSRTYNATNSAKISRTGLNADSVSYLYSGSNNIPAKEGETFTIQARFYTEDADAIDSLGVVFGIWFYNSDGQSLNVSGSRQFIELKNNEWIHKELTHTCPAGTTSVAFVVGSTRNGTFWVAQPKLERGDVSTPYSLAPDDRIKEVRFYAGASYEHRENAPLMIYNDGSIKSDSPDNIFAGIFTGEVRIGNITIKDPNQYAGNDSILTIQNGDNGIKRVQLTDTDESTFAQDIVVCDNFYNPVISLNQDGNGKFKHGINIGDKTYIEDGTMTMNDFELTADTKGFIFNSPEVSIGTINHESLFRVYGPTYLNGEVNVDSVINFGNVIKCVKKSNGLDFVFIN